MTNTFVGDHDSVDIAIDDFIIHYQETARVFKDSVRSAGRIVPKGNFREIVSELTPHIRKAAEKGEYARVETGRVMLEFEPNDGGQIGVYLFLGSIYGTEETGFTVDEDMNLE